MNSVKALSIILENMNASEQPNQVNQMDQQGPSEDQVAQVAAMDDEPIRGPEDPIKSFIDRMIDTKNKILQDRSQSEISNVVNSQHM